MTRPSGPYGLRVVVNPEGQRVAVSARRLRAASLAVLRAEKVSHALVSVTLLSRAQMAAMNRKHLGHSGATDVIAFGFRDPHGAVIGDVYLCPVVAGANARRFAVGVREELLRLTIHGTLHVLGHDHAGDESRVRSPMWRQQERLLAKVMRA